MSQSYHPLFFDKPMLVVSVFPAFAGKNAHSCQAVVLLRAFVLSLLLVYTFVCMGTTRTMRIQGGSSLELYIVV